MRSYTPIFDDIAEKHGLITAAVYGYVWRCCQRDRGVCDASFKTIAADLNISRRTIVTHIKLLVKHNLITDLTPQNDRKPHTYLVQEMHQTREINALDESATREINAGGGEINALALGQEMHQTRARDAPKDTKLKRNNIRDKDYIYKHPDPEPIAKIKTQLSVTTKTPYGVGINEEEYDSAAHWLYGNDFTVNDIETFGDWWLINGHYQGKPALKSLLQEIPNCRNGVLGNSNGKQEAQKDRIRKLLADDDKIVINR